MHEFAYSANIAKECSEAGEEVRRERNESMSAVTVLDRKRTKRIFSRWERRNCQALRLPVGFRLVMKCGEITNEGKLSEESLGAGMMGVAVGVGV